jgi:hypothetical protein
MNALREWARRNRSIAAFLDRARDRRRDAAFAAHLAGSVGVAVQWQSTAEPLASIREQLKLLQSIPEPAARKGSPSKVALRRPHLQLLTQVMDSQAAIGARELRAAERVASIDPADRSAFTLYLAVLWLANAEMIRSLRHSARDRIVLHMTCSSRLSRAERSIDSFPKGAAGASHVTLIGVGNTCTFDAQSGVLGVACDDSYECLPQKVFQGLSLLTLAHNPSVLLKLDDDHRLADARELEKLFEFAASRTQEALQLGEVNHTPSPSAHHRAWHCGKCASAELNERLLEMPAPAQWAAGSSGYIVNRAGLWRILWATAYYQQWLEAILYEDLALAEVATKTGIRIVQVEMSRAIGAVSEY